MLIILLCSCFSAQILKNENITPITDANFKAVIEKRKKGETWFLMFYGDFCPACRLSAPHFEKAAGHAIGNLHFGAVDTKKASRYSRKYEVRYLPSYKIFTNTNEVVDYSGRRDSSSLLKGVNPYFDGCLSTFQDSWFNESLNSAVMYTTSEVAPFPWKALSCYFQNTFQKENPKILTIRFGHSSDAASRISHGSSLVPVIFAKNQTDIVKFTSLDHIEKSLKEFYTGHNGRLPVLNFYLPSELKTECIAPTQFCIISATDDSKILAKLAQEVTRFPKRLKIRFFQGSEGWPFNKIHQNDTWIIEPGLQRGTKLSLSQLSYELKKIVQKQSNLNWIELSN